MSSNSKSAKKRAVPSNVLPPTSNLEDALTGVVSEKTFVHSQGSDGKPHRKSRRHWSWNPPRAGRGDQRDPEVHVHRDGYTTAHPGSLAADVRPDAAMAHLRAAGLNAEEVSVFIARAAGCTYPEIRDQLRLRHESTAKRRYVSATKKKDAYAAALAKMSGGL